MDEMSEQKVSPLKLLAALHHEKMKKPTKVTPKSKIVTEVQDVTRVIPEVLPAIDEIPSTQLAEKLDISESALNIQDSTLVLNFNFNLDGEAVKNAVANSAKLVTGLAASAAMIGSAFVASASNHKKKSTVTTLPNVRKIKLPRD